tara:strand:+ start:390 stop:1187 length:798 start_codon:yes stop_codon:yes gene_type:complete
MSKYRKREKLKEGEGKLYQVRMNVGEAYTQPARKKIWTMGIDERGGYWTRLLRAKNREDAVDYLLTWFRNKKYMGKRFKDSVFNKLPRYADECLEVADDYNEVVFYPTMQPCKSKYRLLTPEKLNEIIKLSKGTFKKTVDYSKRGCFTQTKEYYKKKDRERLIKVPNAPYVYQHYQTNRYHAKIQIKGKIREGGYMEWLGCEKDEKGLYTTVHWKHKRGVVTSGSKHKWYLLSSTDLPKAVAEAKKLREKYPKRKTGTGRYFNKP